MAAGSTLVEVELGVSASAPASVAVVPSRARQKRVRLMGMPIDAITEGEAVQHIAGAACRGEGGWVITPNLDQLRMFRAKPELQAMYESAELVLADGMPLVWASRVQRTPLPQRVAGSTLVFPVCEQAAKLGLSVYFLGGNPGAAQGAAEAMQARYPGLQVAGTCCPVFGFESDADQMRAIESMVRNANPDIVFVGLGFPKQEKLIERLRKVLPGAWFLGIGISFSFITGEVRRAPRWMQRMGLEWVHRLTQEPGRLFKRYVVHGIPFGGRLMLHATKRRFVRNRAA